MRSFVEIFSAALHEATKDRDRLAMEVRYGLVGEDARTLTDVGAALGLSRERARQIIEKAHTRIRSRGLRAVKLQNHDSPSAHLVLHVREAVTRSGVDEIDGIVDYIEDELAFLPPVTHALYLVNYLTCPHWNNIKPRLAVLRDRFCAHMRQTRYDRIQSWRLADLLASVCWPVRVSTFGTGDFQAVRPQRQVSENGEGCAGAFFSKKLRRDVQYESLLERAYLLRLDRLDDVVFYVEQPFRVGYKMRGEPHSYYPDVLVLLRDGRGFVVEIKPAFQMGYTINLCKWEALRTYCGEHGLGMLVTDGKHCTHKVQQMGESA